MAKKYFLLLVLTVFAAGGVFAQTSTPKNAITVDFGRAITSSAIKNFYKYHGYYDYSSDEVKSMGISIGLQYERQMLKNLSMGVRAVFQRYSDNESIGYFTALSLEDHIRYYPFGGGPFLDGMIGLGYVDEYNEYYYSGYYYDSGYYYYDSISMFYLKYGVKLGWRLDIGKPGGLIFEPSVGYYAGNLNAETEGIGGLLCIGTFRFSLAAGWRF